MDEPVRFAACSPTCHASKATGAKSRQGLATADDFRFVRAFWEVDPRRIARALRRRAKGSGGAPSPRAASTARTGPTFTWSSTGRVKASASETSTGAVVRNPRYYFRSGLTWPLRTNSGFGSRILPAGCVFADKGPAIIERRAAVAPRVAQQPGSPHADRCHRGSADEDKTRRIAQLRGRTHSEPAVAGALGIDDALKLLATSPLLAARDCDSTRQPSVRRRTVRRQSPIREAVRASMPTVAAKRLRRSRSTRRWIERHRCRDPTTGSRRRFDASGPVLDELSTRT